MADEEYTEIVRQRMRDEGLLPPKPHGEPKPLTWRRWVKLLFLRLVRGMRGKA
jgi:hypothetical protein